MWKIEENFDDHIILEKSKEKTIASSLKPQTRLTTGVTSKYSTRYKPRVTTRYTSGVKTKYSTKVKHRDPHIDLSEEGYIKLKEFESRNK